MAPKKAGKRPPSPSMEDLARDPKQQKIDVVVERLKQRGARLMGTASSGSTASSAGPSVGPLVPVAVELTTDVAARRRAAAARLERAREIVQGVTVEATVHTVVKTEPEDGA